MWAPLLCFGLVKLDFNLSGPFNYLDTGRWFRRHFVGFERVNLLLRDINTTGDEYVIRDIHSIAETD